MARPFQNANDLVGSGACSILKPVLRISTWMAGTSPAMTEPMGLDAKPQIVASVAALPEN
jgi:hypothetical protein